MCCTSMCEDVWCVCVWTIGSTQVSVGGGDEKIVSDV